MTFKHKQGWAIRRVTKSLERIKHKQDRQVTRMTMVGDKGDVKV